MTVTIKLKNKPLFFARLKAIVPRMEEELAKANSKSADAMVASALRLVPVDPNDEDGIHLRDSIVAFKGKFRAAYIVQAGGASTTKPSRGGRYDYALAVEYGTQDTTAQPFFWPSYRLNRKPMKARATRAIRKAIKDAGF